MSEADPKRRRSAPPPPLPLPPQVALVLQGGGALGSFQGGIYEALHEASIEIDWVAGISIGAVNAAIIAGNPPERRLARMKEFWAIVTSALPSFPIPFVHDQMREALNEWSAALVATGGVPGFFSPGPWAACDGDPRHDRGAELLRHDPACRDAERPRRLGSAQRRGGALSVGAVEIESGNFRFFDTRHDRIDHRHIMASGALPPGLPPVEIDGKWYWDGGVVSNTPLSHVLDNQTEDMLIFQVDLFSSKGALPRTMMDVAARAKEIQYSSRTRTISDQLMKARKRREVAQRVLAKLPPELQDDPDVKELTAIAHENAVALVQLIYRANAWEGGSRDYEFSERTRVEHWQAGRDAVARTISNSAVLAKDISGRKTMAFDLNRP